MMMPITTGLQFGRYVIRARLGAAGMGEVFLADDTQLGRRVALKYCRLKRRPIRWRSGAC